MPVIMLVRLFKREGLLAHLRAICMHVTFDGMRWRVRCRERSLAAVRFSCEGTRYIDSVGAHRCLLLRISRHKGLERTIGRFA